MGSNPLLTNLNILSSFLDLKIHNGLRLSTCAGMGLHAREGGCEAMIFILNSNPTNLNF